MSCFFGGSRGSCSLGAVEFLPPLRWLPSRFLADGVLFHQSQVAGGLARLNLQTGVGSAQGRTFSSLVMLHFMAQGQGPSPPKWPIAVARSRHPSGEFCPALCVHEQPVYILPRWVLGMEDIHLFSSCILLPGDLDVSAVGHQLSALFQRPRVCAALLLVLISASR